MVQLLKKKPDHERVKDLEYLYLHSLGTIYTFEDTIYTSFFYAWVELLFISLRIRRYTYTFTLHLGGVVLDRHIVHP